MITIKPEIDLEKYLKGVHQPARYLGGEFGSIKKNPENVKLKVAICFPDLYEIGMSNKAIRIIYSLLNSMEDVLCERFFAVAPDFEKILRDNTVPLYSLENGIPLSDFDVVAFSIGTEMHATNILQILDLGGVPILKNMRNINHPIVIAGGPASTNPMPFSDFIDAVYIGEFEQDYFQVFSSIKQTIQNFGRNRTELIKCLEAFTFIWTDDKNAIRTVWNGFSESRVIGKPLVATVKPVQDQGIVEIMRGCPNGCRFCHAGIYYRPQRERKIEWIIEEVEQLVSEGAFRDISLASLSTGDYSGIMTLVDELNKIYAVQKVSFSLPSVKINSFTLGLLEKVSEVKKSGLTFAVETPLINWQRSLNKEIEEQKILEILAEAKEHGWKLAKLYFMVGLPASINDDESEAIVSFILNIRKKSGMALNINVGTYIPKPHTPFQWAPQLTEEESWTRLMKIKNSIKDRNIDINYHEPFVSFLEGFICRGGKDAGKVILNAYNKGARLDAWAEFLRKDLWREAFREADIDVQQVVCNEREIDKPLPWDSVNLGVSKAYLLEEKIKSESNILTPACSDDCDMPCGCCNKNVQIQHISNIEPDLSMIKFKFSRYDKTEEIYRFYFIFSKSGKAAYISHLHTHFTLERAFLRSGLIFNYSRGFHPRPVMEFSNPVSLGTWVGEDIGLIEVKCIPLNKTELIAEINQNLPEGFMIIDYFLQKYSVNEKKYSLMSLFDHADYQVESMNSLEDELILFETLLSNAEILYVRSNSSILISSNDKKGLTINKIIDKTMTRDEFNAVYRLKRNGIYCNFKDQISSFKDYFSSFDLFQK